MCLHSVNSLGYKKGINMNNVVDEPPTGWKMKKDYNTFKMFVYTVQSIYLYVCCSGMGSLYVGDVRRCLFTFG